MNGRSNPQRTVNDGSTHSFVLRPTGTQDRSNKARKTVAYHGRVCRKGGSNTQNSFYLLRAGQVPEDPQERPRQVGNSQIGITVIQKNCRPSPSRLIIMFIPRTVETGGFISN